MTSQLETQEKEPSLRDALWAGYDALSRLGQKAAAERLLKEFDRILNNRAKARVRTRTQRCLKKLGYSKAEIKQAMKPSRRKP